MTWIDVLRAECERTSQAQVARRLGVSSAMVCQVLGGHYKAAADNIQARVEGELMSRTVMCPIEGEISTKRCLDNQRRPFAASNFQRVRLFRACRECERRNS